MTDTSTTTTPHSLAHPNAHHRQDPPRMSRISGCTTGLMIAGAPLPSRTEQDVEIDRTDNWMYLEVPVPHLGVVESLSVAIPIDQIRAWADQHLGGTS